MLARVLQDIPTVQNDDGKVETVTTVRTACAAWTELTARAWAVLLHNGAEHIDIDSGRAWHRGARLAFVRPVSMPKSSSRGVKKDADADIQRALWNGLPIIGFAPDEAFLPEDLVQAADRHIVMPKPSSVDVAALAGRLCENEPSVQLTDEEAATLSPRLVRLARRLDQSPDDYVGKLRDLVARESAVPQARPEGPRDAPTLERLHGMDEAVAWGMSLRVSLQAHAAGKLAWKDVDNAVLLSGPPGTGKTTFARALAKSCDLPLHTGSYAQWLANGSGHQGDMLMAMRKTFKEAKKQAPCILLLDEVDSFGDRGTMPIYHAEWAIPVINALLAEMDGVEGREGVVVVAACNHPDKLDPALVRSGRLDRHIGISLPDQEALALILHEHLGDDLPGVSLAGAALAAAGVTGADCERFVRGVRRRAREAKRAATLDDLMEEIGGSDTRTDEELRVAAVHEAGHGVARCELLPGTLRAVTLRPGNGTGGSTASEDTAQYLLAEDVHLRMVFLLAARAAEELVLGTPSSGAGGNADSDLARATRLAMTAVCSLGFSDKVGLVWAGLPDPSDPTRMLAEHPAAAAEIRRMLDRAYEDALELVKHRQAAVEAVAKTLLARRVLDGAAVAEIVARHPAQVGKVLAP